jgi:hypothetical protein
MFSDPAPWACPKDYQLIEKRVESFAIDQQHDMR